MEFLKEFKRNFPFPQHFPISTAYSRFANTSAYLSIFCVHACVCERERGGGVDYESLKMAPQGRKHQHYLH